MIATTDRLTPEQLVQVRELAQVVTSHDGGRLKLELGHLESHPAPAALAYDGSRLLGFGAVYAFGGSEPEIAGMVAPSARRRGLGGALLDALLPPSRTALLVVPAGTPAGTAFARSRGGTLSHSEHFLVLGETPPEPPAAGIELRPATADDLPALGQVLAAAFGEPAHEVRLDAPGDTTYAIERDGELVGTVRLSVREDWGGVYGFAVRPEAQGRGVGRDVLARVCRMLRQDGRQRVTLEVETRNEHALRLYTSTGFVREAGEDYWRVGA